MRALALVAALAATPVAADPCADVRAMLDATRIAAGDMAPILGRAGMTAAVGMLHEEPLRSRFAVISGDANSAMQAMLDLMNEMTRIAEQSECSR